MKLIEVKKSKVAIAALSVENLGEFVIISNNLHIFSDTISKVLIKPLQDLGFWSDKMEKGFLFGSNEIAEMLKQDDKIVFYSYGYTVSSKMSD